jgi:hypothetical protein
LAEGSIIRVVAGAQAARSMSAMNRKFAVVLEELRAHVPFTLFGSLTGIAMMLLFQNLPEATTYRLFYVFHPLHVTLSAVSVHLPAARELGASSCWSATSLVGTRP